MFFELFDILFGCDEIDVKVISKKN